MTMNLNYGTLLFLSEKQFSFEILSQGVLAFLQSSRVRSGLTGFLSWCIVALCTVMKFFPLGAPFTLIWAPMEVYLFLLPGEAPFLLSGTDAETP